MTVYELVLNGESPSGDTLTVLHYDIEGDDPINFQDLANQIRADIAIDLVSILAPSCLYSGITVREDTPGSVGQTFDFTSGDIVGTSTDNQYAPQMACIVRKVAGNLTRPNKGRIYQGMLTSEGFTSQGLWSSSVRDALDIFWGNMISHTFAGNGTAEMQIKASNPTAPNTVAYNPVSSVTARSNPATQRRRRLGSGS